MNPFTLAVDIIAGIIILLFIFHPKWRAVLIKSIKGNKKKKDE